MLFVFDRIEFENLFRYTVVTERKFEIETDTKVTLRQWFTEYAELVPVPAKLFYKFYSKFYTDSSR